MTGTRKTTRLLIALAGVLGLIFGSFSIASATADGAQDAVAPAHSQQAAAAQDHDEEEEEEEDGNQGHERGEHPPADNNENPDDPPCDADHGHPGDNAPQCEDEDHPGNRGQKPDDRGPDNGEEEEEEEELGTCEQGGIRGEEEPTIANEAFGTENEEGPISSGIHENESEFQELEPVVHEGSCVVATVDNNF